MPHGACDRHVLQLGPVTRASQQQAPSTHVAAPDEVRGEHEARAEDVLQQIDVLAGGDAAEQDDLASTVGNARRDRARVA